jgi:hypothetical protein
MKQQLMTKVCVEALAESMQKCDLRVTIEYRLRCVHPSDDVEADGKTLRTVCQRRNGLS